jgi:hypothetical protein
MKRFLYLFSVLVIFLLSPACKKSSDDNNSTPSIGGEISPMSAIGTTVTSSSTPIVGVSGLTASVVSLSDGVSSYNGNGIVANTGIKNILSNFPDFTINGDTVSVTGFKFRQTVEGIECQNSMGPGLIVNYNSSVGATYPVGSTGRVRTVISKSTTDDYPYGLFMIKVMKIEEPTPTLTSIGINKVTYWANHRFGLVGVKFDFSNGISTIFPVYTSTSNSK